VSRPPDLRENECYATTINGLELHYLGPSLEKAAEELAQDYYVFREETPELIVQVERGDGRRGRFVVRIEIVQKVTVAEIPEYGAPGSALPRRVLEALELATGSPNVRLHLNPEDHKALGTQVRTLIDAMSGLGAAEVTADAAIGRGGCRVETRFGAIDQQFESQLKRIEEELTG